MYRSVECLLGEHERREAERRQKNSRHLCHNVISPSPTMIEPRSGSLHIRQPSLTIPDNLEDEGDRILEDEPSQPVHPELEYEILLDDSSTAGKMHDPNARWKLGLSFGFLVISGAANVIMTKLQAIPM